MFELLLNGLNVCGGLAGIYSFASGFSVARDVGAIKVSLEKLEENEEILHRMVIEQNAALAEVFSCVRKFKSSTDTSSQMTLLEATSSALKRYDIDDAARKIADAIVGEMRSVLNAIKFDSSDLITLPRNLLAGLIREPTLFGQSNVFDISDGGVLSFRRYCTATPNTTPITWGNPLTGRMYLREIPNPMLARFGLRVTPPVYAELVDGHVYSKRHNLYIPHYAVDWH